MNCNLSFSIDVCILTMIEWIYHIKISLQRPWVIKFTLSYELKKENTQYRVENKGCAVTNGNPRVESEECGMTSRLCAHEAISTNWRRVADKTIDAGTLCVSERSVCRCVLICIGCPYQSPCCENILKFRISVWKLAFLRIHGYKNKTKDISNIRLTKMAYV